MRLQASKAGDEPIPGYILRKRLGAGGYGEVWQADAPGGLQKAIKLVFGTVDESYAASELKSLERIRALNHPFLLSLERIEIVDNQVAIVTELAESSLLDRFEHYRRKGEPGIPRAMLLEFVRDTADALDFLSQKHFLQHLDIKPGNLLIVADRVKVGDFGLVKDLHDQTQSLVAGLTPTYSAPEIFDGRPDHRTDQYSLAIVYMEMLTGRLPFKGKTTGELARQHLHQAPELEALPPADRVAIGRALSKNPLDRFNNCRALVDQLQKNRGVAPVQLQPAQSTTESKTSAPRNGANEDSRTGTTQDPASKHTAATIGVRHQFHPRLSIDAARSQWRPPRCLFVGLGGMGCQVLAELHAQVAENVDAQYSVDEHAWLAIDTSSDALDQLSDEALGGHLPTRQTLQIPIYGPATYRKLEPTRFGPLSRRWLYNIPKSRTTEGVRPLAILSLLHHFDVVKSRMAEEIGRLLNSRGGDEQQQARDPIHVYVLSSMHGGTGGALMGEIGFLIRQVFQDFSTSDYRLTAIATAAMTAGNSHASLPAAAAMSCLSELSYYMKGDKDVVPICPSNSLGLQHGRRPFDWVTLVDGGLHGKNAETAAAVQRAADYVLADSQTMLSSLLSEERIPDAAVESGWFRAGCADRIYAASSADRSYLTSWCLEQSLSHLEDYLLGPNDSTSPKDISRDTDTDLSPTVRGELLLTEQACEDFTRRLLKDLGIIEGQMLLSEMTDNEEGTQLLSGWARRLSTETQNHQLSADIEIWKRSVSTIMQMRVYNWRQIEQIQLNVIEGLLNFCDHRTQELVRLFEPFSEILGPTEHLSKMATDYLRKFTEQCFGVLERYRSEGRELARRLKRWQVTVSAELDQHPASCRGTMASLSPQLQAGARKVIALLDSVLNGELLRILDRAVAESKSDYDSSDPGNVLDLRYLMNFAASKVEMLQDEPGIDLVEDIDAAGNEEQQGISISELANYYPLISQQGGRSHRFVISPVDQLQDLEDVLEQNQLSETTTCVPSTKSMGSLAVSESNRVPISHLVATLWRPSSASLQLAERLHSRADIEWEPIGNLLQNHNYEPDGFAASTASPIVVGEPQPMDSGTISLQN